MLVGGQGLLEGAILKTMALHPGSDRLHTWLNPPVQAHLTGYGFHVTNPEAVMQGKKPIVKEVGPFTYKAVTVKDSVDKDTGKENLEYNEDGETLTYRPRLSLFSYQSFYNKFLSGNSISLTLARVLVILTPPSSPSPTFLSSPASTRSETWSGARVQRLTW